jgi:hypothetical protein
MCTVILILFLPTIRNPNMGGVARRASLIETIRKRTLMYYYLTPVIFFRDSLL